MIKRTDLSEEEKRKVAYKHEKKVKINMVFFVVSVLSMLRTVISLGKYSDTVIQAGLYGSGGLLLISMLNLNVRNHCPFCGLKMDNSRGKRSPLMMDFPNVCPLCGERLRYW